ncbi:FG-GAP repeat domain-containing protein [Halocynthiibacter sp.]|uniref:FG-GAP repeat domain-containing protein n=1 Tax=Halocynthiibacter sp. TaxID=1979210 RepID=UPI003C5EC442
MFAIAPRLMPRQRRYGIRGALLALCLWLMPQVATADEPITGAHFLGETRVYAHGVLGDETEYAVLAIDSETTDGQRLRRSFSVAPEHVFEDLEPRLWDLDSDGAPEVVVVLTSVTQGASLAAFTTDGLLARTPFIGRKNRWLAPVAAADLDGDGRVEIAYIDRPHLAKTLRLWRLEQDRLVEITTLSGLTNHRIGDDFIQSGVRDCGSGPELITADATWQSVMATTFDGNQLRSRQIADYTNPDDITTALNCG